MKRCPFLSVVIASQDAGAALCFTLDSLFAQDCRDFEVVIQGPGPEAAERIGNYTAFARDRLIIGTEPDTGIYDAFNKAVRLCRGEWLVFVGTGDFCCSPQAVGSVLATLRNAPASCEFYAFPISTAFPSGRPIDTLRPSENPVRDLPQGMCLPHPGLFQRRRLFERQIFNPAYRIAGDYDFVCRTVTADNVCRGELPWLTMVVGGVSSSLMTLAQSEEELLRIAERSFPGARLWRPRLRLLRSRATLRIARLFGPKAACLFADVPRLLRGKAPLWSSPAWKATAPLPFMKPKPQIDLVVATLGRTAPLERLFESLEQQTYTNFHVYLADQNPEGFLDAVLAAHPRLPVTHIRLPFQGVSRARNAGLSLCTGDIVGFPDDDCWYAPDTLDEVQSLFRDRPDAGSMAGNLTYLPDPAAASRQQASSRYRIMSRFGCFYRDGAAALFVRRDLAEKAGGFRPDLGPREGAPYACGEDIDYHLRLYRTGYTTLRACRALIFHMSPHHALQATPQKTAAYAKGRMELCARHGLPWWFRLLNILYPLAALLPDAVRYGPAGVRYRGTMFWARLMTVLKR